MKQKPSTQSRLAAHRVMVDQAVRDLQKLSYPTPVLAGAVNKLKAIAKKRRQLEALKQQVADLEQEV